VYQKILVLRLEPSAQHMALLAAAVGEARGDVGVMNEHGNIHQQLVENERLGTGKRGQ